MKYNGMDCEYYIMRYTWWVTNYSTTRYGSYATVKSDTNLMYSTSYYEFFKNYGWNYLLKNEDSNYKEDFEPS